MDSVDSKFESILNGFFTKENCNNWSKEEDDFQKRVAKYLVKKDYKVLREVVITDKEVPAIQSELGLEYRRIDIVAYKDERFYFVELKFENINDQSHHVTKVSYDDDKKKSLPIFRFYSDIVAVFRRVLTNNPTVIKDLGGEWKSLQDEEKREGAFMWQGDCIDDNTCKCQDNHTFCGPWNRIVCERWEKGFKEGDDAGYVDPVK